MDFWFIDTTPWMKVNYVEQRHAEKGDISEKSREDFIHQRNKVSNKFNGFLRNSVEQSKAKKNILSDTTSLWTYGYHRNADHTSLSDVVLDLHSKHDLTAYLCGHDHSLQHIYQHGLHQFLSGAGSSSFEVFDGPGLMFKSTPDNHGYLMMYDNGTSAFIDGSNSILYTISKKKIKGAHSFNVMFHSTNAYTILYFLDSLWNTVANRSYDVAQLPLHCVSRWPCATHLLRQ